MDFEILIQVCDVDGYKGHKCGKRECGGTVYTSVLIVGRVFEKIAAGNESGQIGMAYIVYALPKNLDFALQVDGNHWRDNSTGESDQI